MKKIMFLFALAASVAVWAGNGRSGTSTNSSAKTKTAQEEHKCLQCPNQKLEERYITVGWKKCKECMGKGWFGEKGKSKEECRKNKTLADPCPYCNGKGKKAIKDWRWVCPRCKAVYAK